MKPVLLFESDVQAVHAALVKAGETQLAEMVAEKAKRSEHDLKFIEGIPALDDCDYHVGDCPVVSASEGGAYVLVWRWVTNEEAGIVSPVASLGSPVASLVSPGAKNFTMSKNTEPLNRDFIIITYRGDLLSKLPKCHPSRLTPDGNTEQSIEILRGNGYQPGQYDHPSLRALIEGSALKDARNLGEVLGMRWVIASTEGLS